MKLAKNDFWFVGLLGFFLISCRSTSTEKEIPVVELTYSKTSKLDDRRILSENASKQFGFSKNSSEIMAKIDNNENLAVEIPLARATLWQQGELDLQNGYFRDALEKAQKVFRELEQSERLATRLSLENDAKNAYLFVAKTYSNFNAFEQNSVHILTKLIEIDSKKEDFYRILAKIYSAKSAFILAENVLLQGLNKIEKPSENFYFELASQQKKNEKLAQAMQTVATAKSVYPGSQLLSFWHGVVDFENGNRVAACEAFEKTHAELKEIAASHYNLILCSVRQNDLILARKKVDIALLAFPKEPRFKLLSGVIEQKSGHTIAARKAFNEYLLATDDEGMRLKIKSALDSLL